MSEAPMPDETGDNGAHTEPPTDSESKETVPKQRGPPKKRAAEEEEEENKLERKSTREKKISTKFMPDTSFMEPKDRSVVVLDGEGEDLGSIQNIHRALDQVKSGDPILKKLHGVLYGTPGVKLSIKRHIRQFKGVPKADQGVWRAKMKAKLDKMEGAGDLKPLCRLLDLEVSGTREDAIERILGFLMQPKASGHEFKGVSSKKHSKKKTAKKRKTVEKEKKAAGEKRTSGYLLFANANRPTVKAKNPELSFGEIGKKLGKLWGKLNEAEKATWTLKAQSQGSDPNSPKKPAKKKTKNEESSSSEGSDNDEDTPLQPALDKNVEAKIREIVRGGDLKVLSVKKIKLQLAELFGEQLVTDHSSEIKDFITKCVAEQ